MTAFPAQTIEDLRTSANAAIASALSRGAAQMRLPIRTEPGLVAAVHLGAIPAITKAWFGPLSKLGLQVELTGVFCHQSPYVTFSDGTGRPRRCELADLLVVVDSQTPSWTGRRAALIQAKMAAGVQTVKIKSETDLVQLELYQTWPLFDFELTEYKLKTVNLKQGSNPDQSGTYGIIDRHLDRTKAPRWTQHPASPTPKKTDGFPELGDYLVEMVAGNPAFGRDADAKVNPEWSKVVDALLRVSLGKSFTHSATLGAVAQPRSTASLAFKSVSSFMLSTGAGRPKDGAFSLFEGDPSGISTLYVRIGVA